jgi:regulatory protein
VTLLQPHLDKARRWCSIQERAALQVLLRLQEQGCALPQAEEILGILQAEGYQDDARLAQVYARSKAVHAAWGPVKIRHALRRMGVADTYIDTALTMLDAELAQTRLDKTLTSKLHTLAREKDPWQRKAKLFRFLQQKGYTTGQIQEAIQRLGIAFDTYTD